MFDHLAGVAMFDATSQKKPPEAVFRVEEGRVRCVAYSFDGSALAAGCDDGVTLFNTTSRQSLRGSPMPGGDGSVRCLAFSPDGKILAGGYDEPLGKVVLFDTTNMHRLRYASLEGNGISVS
jgi:WD40 repeat protein